MPTFHKRTTKPGYCIRARPPEAGNVTYQITPQALDFLQDLGFTDGDDPGWKLIKTLRIVGDLYTHSEGGPDEVNRSEIDPLGTAAVTGLSDGTLKQLLAYLCNHQRVTDEVVEKFPSEIKDKLTDQTDSNSVSDSVTEDTGPSEDELNQILASFDKEITLQSVPDDISDVLHEWYRNDMMLSSPDTVDEFIVNMSDIPGYKESIRAFDNHPGELLNFIGFPSALMYSMSFSEGLRITIRDCRWETEETVGERDCELGIADADFYISVSGTQRQYVATHQILVTDGLLSWNVSTDVESLVASGMESESEAEHRILEEKAVLFDVICEFFEDFEDYSIERSLL